MTEPTKTPLSVEQIEEAMSKLWAEHKVDPTAVYMSPRNYAWLRAYTEIRYDLFGIRRGLRVKKILREMQHG
jgi:hypothetical protein